MFIQSYTMTMRTKYGVLFLFFLLYNRYLVVQSVDQNESPINTTIDPYAFLHIIPNPDGSITRINEFFPTVHPNVSSLAISKDKSLNPEKNTWVRVYLPNGSGIERLGKLPVVVFAHGGGFILLSAASPNYDNLCSYTANRLNALVVSVNYRLAPEHRLPAAYDDVLEALYWVRDGKDEWVRDHGDVSRCFLMGTSAGANTAYQVGLEVTSRVNELKPLTLKGLILVQPFFGGLKRTRSELKLINDQVIPLVVTDLMWELALPIGTNRDNMYCNPVIRGGSSKLKKVMKMGLQVAVLGCDGDPLFDRQVEFVKLLEKRGVKVKSSFCQGGSHGIYNKETAKIEELLQFVKSVFSSCLFG
ncbi:carboxylesterase 20-like [Silene latifolia]|uniref:carboxylesterase 20-like n=1 Tax=Silene latifolia TaxID=37657 RepID=UPI003D76B2C2